MVTLGFCVYQGYSGAAQIDRAASGGRTLFAEILPGLSGVDDVALALAALRVAEAEALLATSAAGRDEARGQKLDAAEMRLGAATKALAAASPSSDDNERASRDRLLAGGAKYRALDAALSKLLQQGEAGSAQAAELYRGEMRLVFEGAGEDFGRLSALRKDEAARVGQADQATAQWARKHAWVASLCAALAAAATAAFAHFGLARPARKLAEAMRKLAAGDTQAVIPGAERWDELGEMARAVLAYRDSAIERQRLEEALRADRRRESLRQSNLELSIGHFRAAAGGIVAQVKAQAGATRGAGQGLAEAAAHAECVVRGARRAVADSPDDVLAVAEAGGRLSASLAAISLQNSETTGLLGEAARRLNEAVEIFLGAVAKDVSERRSSLRLRSTKGVVIFANGRQAQTNLADISDTGVRIVATDQLRQGDRIAIELEDRARVAATVVWVRDGFAGAQFDRPISQLAVQAAA